MHHDFADTVVRHLHRFALSGMKSSFLMFLHSLYSNISTHSFCCTLYILLQSFMRSFTTNNFQITDVLSPMFDMELHSAVDVDPIDLPESDDDDEYKESIMALDASYLALEQQLSIAGVLLHNNVYSMLNVYMFLNISYIDQCVKLSDFFYFSFLLMRTLLAFFTYYV